MRIESKYHLNSYEANSIILYMYKMAYELDPNCSDGNPYDVCSIYFDSFDNVCYHNKLDGLTRRTKIRLRYYSQIEIKSHPLTLEFKEKDNIFGWKVKRNFSYEQVSSLIKNSKGDIHNYIINNFGYLEPRIFIQYKRLAFRHPADKKTRITFDYDMFWRQIDQTKDDFVGSTIFSPLRKDQVIMELKVSREISSDLSSMVQNFGLNWSETSKYKICLDHMIENIL